MRILYHSAAPWIHTGYGTCTEEIAPRLHNGDHKVGIQALSSVKNSPIWWHGDELNYELKEKMRVYPGKGAFGLAGVGEHYEDFNADVLFTHFDTWMKPAREKIPTLEVPYVSYVVVDHDPAPDAVVKSINNSHEVISMSEYATQKLEDKGVRPITIPHGVDTQVYRPLDDDDLPSTVEVRDELGNRREVNPRDRFVFGMVAANHGDRKNIPNHMQAFKMFLEEVNRDAILYIHTEQNSAEGYNLEEVREEIGIPIENIIWPSGDDYGDVGNEYLNAWYNTFDVLVNCSMGESWGLTITEAQAAGTPCIVTNFTSMPEQLGAPPRKKDEINWEIPHHQPYECKIGIAPHGLLVEPDAPIWRERVSSSQMLVKPTSIFAAMKYYYEHQDLIDEHGDTARDYVVENYDWENAILPKFEMLFETLENTIR